ncbi:MAG: GNAT family N-acetyltransferase [Synoicihabitans sp.]
MNIVDATSDMADRLSDLAMRSKASWGYEPSWLSLWQDDLTLVPEYIERHFVKVAECDGELSGFIALNFDDAEIDHLWVEPQAMGKGVGKALFATVRDAMKEAGINEIKIVSDPNAEGFYIGMGAKRVGSVASLPPGRLLPKLSFALSESAELSRGVVD